MRHDPNAINVAARALVGLPLFATSSAGYIQSFQFGTARLVPSALNGRPARKVGDLALNVQCPWQLVDATQRVLGSNQHAGAARAWLLEHACSVDGVRGDAKGGLTLTLTGGVVLVISPDNDQGEHWRLLQPARDAPHFVVTSTGIEEG